MATFLTTSKMDPALAARIERAITGRNKPLISRRLIALTRFGLVAGIVVALYVVITGTRRDRQALEQARAELLADVEGRAAELGDRERTAFVGVESWLARVAAPDAPAEVVPQELSRPGALSEALDRPLLYVRGELDGFAGAERLTSTLAESHKDAVLLCLKEPPRSRTEAGLIESVFLAYGGGPPLEARTPRALRLAELPRSLPLFEAAWADGVRSADSFQRIADLRRELDAFDVERVKRAANAELLLAVVDEPGDAKVPATLEGERPHVVRVALVDLAADKLWLFVKRSVDPSWISEKRRSTYARGLDGCAVAFDVHERLAKGP